MAKSKAFAVAGSKCYLGTGEDWETETDWHEINDVINIDGPGHGRNQIDTTHCTSPDDEEESLSGRKTRKPITLAMSYSPTDYAQNAVTGFKAMRDSGRPRAFAIVYSDEDETVYYCNVLCEDYSKSGQQAGKWDATVTLKITGADDYDEGGLP